MCLPQQARLGGRSSSRQRRLQQQQQLVMTRLLLLLLLVGLPAREASSSRQLAKRQWQQQVVREGERCKQALFVGHWTSCKQLLFDECRILLSYLDRH
jgi:hypothetical protein